MKYTSIVIPLYNEENRIDSCIVEIDKLYSQLKSKYFDRFYIEIQRHGDLNEVSFEKFNLSKSTDFTFLTQQIMILTIIIMSYSSYIS